MSSGVQIFSVNRKPFAVPDFLSVSCSEGFSAFGDAVLAYPSAAGIVHEGAGDGSSTSGAGTPHHGSRKDASKDRASVSAAAGVNNPRNALVIRKYENIASRPRALACVTRMLLLQSGIPEGDVYDFSSVLLPVLDAYVDPSRRGDVYVITPHMPTTLAHVLQSGTRLTMPQVCFVLYEVAVAVQALHRCGVVVGELRPEAVRVDPERLGNPGSVRLADFSLVHLPDESIEVLAKLDPAACNGEPSTQRVASTSSCYRAPEWALELTQKVGFAADVWGLGCLLVELLTRRPLWVARDTSDPREYAHHLSVLLGYPDGSADGAPAADAFISNPHAKKLWREVSEHCCPVGVASLMLSNEEPQMRAAFLLVKRMLCLDPQHRVAVSDILEHPLLRSPAQARSSESFSHRESMASLNTTVTALPLQQTLTRPMAAAVRGGALLSDGAAVSSSPTHNNGASSFCSSWAIDPSDRAQLLTKLYGVVRTAQ